jgi:tetratricopeptide (TPR) repeat protein
VLQDLEGTPELTDELGLYNKLGDLYLKLGDVTSAVEQYEKAIGHYAEHGFPNNAIALCNKVLRNAPGRTPIYLKLAKLMLQRGFVAEAKQNLLEYAERMQKAGKLEDAFHALREFADLSPDNEEIRLLLAEQLQKAARTDEAREQLAKLYQEVQAMGDTRRARATMDRMRAIDPEYDLDAIPTQKATSRKQKTTDIVFIDLDEGRKPAEPAVEFGEEEPQEPVDVPASQQHVDVEQPLEIAPTTIGETQEVVDRGYEGNHSAELSPEVVGFETEATEATPLEGLDVSEPFAAGEEIPGELLDVEQTLLDEAVLGDEVPEGGDLPLLASLEGEMLADESDESEREVAGPWVDAEEEAAVETGYEPSGELIGEWDETLPSLDLEAGVEVPDLDLGFRGELGEMDLSGVEEIDEESLGHVDIPFLEPQVEWSGDPEDEVEATFESGGEVAGSSAAPDLAESARDEEPVAVEPVESSGFDGESEDLAVVLEPTRPDISDLEDLVLDDPDAPAPHRELAEALLEGGDRERGLQELDIALALYEAADDWRRAESVAEEILRIEPNSVVHHQKRVEYAFRGGDKDALADAYLELADALVRDGSVDRSRSVYQRVLDHDPDNARAISALEALLPEDAKLSEAEQGVEAEPDSGTQETTAWESDVAVEPEEAEVVEPELDEAIDSAPPDEEPAPASVGSGGDFVDLGALILDEEEARDTRMRIREEAPTGDEERDFQEMLAQFKKGIEANVALEDTQAHYDLGIAFKEMGLLDEAISELQKALRGAEGRLKTAEALGLCFFERGQFAVAATVVRRAIETEPGGDDEKIGLLYWLGRCEENQGKKSGALGYYQRILSVETAHAIWRRRGIESDGIPRCACNDGDRPKAGAGRTGRSFCRAGPNNQNGFPSN